MNLINRILLVCSTILASLAVLIAPVQAAAISNLPQVCQAKTIGVHATLPVVLTQPSDQGLNHQGCACASCLKTAELLQGRLPGM
ncbi:MAG TPA: hypothetical protein V6C64_16165 [Microcoleaceae cyanobacterium]|jgi:hypothetical protein